MNLNVGQLSLIDLIGHLERKEIIINRNYQRGSGVWPDSARTYFIDTILEGYPFPKIYLYQTFNPKTKRPIKEIVDGQQRIATIIDFMNDKFQLTAASKKYSKMKYSDLDEDVQLAFQGYQVELSTILSATRPELLEMFRRINAYNAPLSPAEKRHATYQGEFKWFIVEQADQFSPIIEELEILTSKQLSRMADSEYIADLVVSLEKGITQKAAKTIEELYKRHDESFDESERYGEILQSFFTYLTNDLEPIHGTFMMKSYAIHSLFCAYVYCKYGLVGAEQHVTVEQAAGLDDNLDNVIRSLEMLAHAHEEQDETGASAKYVKACLSSTTKTPQRIERFKALVNVLAKK